MGILQSLTISARNEYFQTSGWDRLDHLKAWWPWKHGDWINAIANPMVEYLNSLRTQQQSSNATYIHEARSDFLRSLRRRAPWFPDEKRLHVRTQLDVLIDHL